MEINLNTDFQLALLDQSANDLLMHYIWVWINSLKYNFGRQSILYWFELEIKIWIKELIVKNFE